MEVLWKMMFLFKQVIFRFPAINFPGCYSKFFAASNLQRFDSHQDVASLNPVIHYNKFAQRISMDSFYVPT